MDPFLGFHHTKRSLFCKTQLGLACPGTADTQFLPSRTASLCCGTWVLQALANPVNRGFLCNTLLINGCLIHSVVQKTIAFSSGREVKLMSLGHALQV